MTWAALRAECEQVLAKAGEERPARLVLDWFDDVFGKASRRQDDDVPSANLTLALKQLEAIVEGKPLAYVTGITHFYGYELVIREGVLIPRPETEELVRWIEESHGMYPALRFADLCTGSGCIAVALARKRPTWCGVAVDISPYAIDIANENLRKHAVADQLEVLQTDLFASDAAASIGSVDLIVSNPPYIPDGDWGRVASGVSAYEPHLALRVPDESPLLFYERILQLAQSTLSPVGWLYFECNDRYVETVKLLLDESGYAEVEIFLDMQGRQRHVRGRKLNGSVDNS